MKSRCIDAVNLAAGRALTKAQIESIDATMEFHYRRAKSEQAANGWSDADTLREAATAAAGEFRATVAKKAQRVALDINSKAERAAQYAELKAVWKSPTKALGRMIEISATYQKGVRAQAFGRIVEAIESAEPRFLGMMENAAASRDFVRELFGQDTGNTVAKKGAAAWTKGAEELRLRANRAGFNIGKLDYSFIPQPHDVVRMMNAGKEAWTSAILPRLDRSRYLNEKGVALTDVEMQPVLERAFDTITTNGVNKLDPTEFRGTGGRANRGSAHRAIHFKDADAFMDHMDEFGKGTVWDAMKSHVDSTSSSIGLVEQFGPNPEAHFKQLEAQMLKDEGGKPGTGHGIYWVAPKTQWEVLTGNANQALNPRFAAFNQGARSLQVAGKLGSTFLGAGNDLFVTLPTTALFNQMPVMKTIGQVFKSLGRDQKKFAAEAGLTVDSIIGDMNTFAAENLTGAGWTSKLASGVMKASLLEGWTHAMQRGFSMSMMHMLSDMSKTTEWSALSAADLRRFAAGGVTEADWNVWKAAPRRDMQGAEIIHHDDIAALAAGGSDASKRAYDHAATSLLGYIASESDAALVIPNNYTTAALTRGLQKGTPQGEAIRHVALFKGYSAAIGARYMQRIADLDMNVVGKAGLMVAFTAAMTLMGAVGVQLKSLAVGKDPVDMTGEHAGKFWFKAFAQGGGTGIMGDVVNTALQADRDAGLTLASTLMGPVAGTAVDAVDMTLGEAGKKARGQKTDFGAKALRFVRNNTPLGAPLNLWYTKQAVDHMFFHELQEAASPGYLSRQQQRSQKEFGQAYYWKPGHGGPQRAPDLPKMAGAR